MMMHQPYRHQPWQLERCNPLNHSCAPRTACLNLEMQFLDDDAEKHHHQVSSASTFCAHVFEITDVPLEAA